MVTSDEEHALSTTRFGPVRSRKCEMWAATKFWLTCGDVGPLGGLQVRAVVARARADEDADRPSPYLVLAVPGVPQAFHGHLQRLARQRVQVACRLGVESEELRVEQGGVVQESAPFALAASRSAVRAVEGGHVPAVGRRPR